MYQLFSQKGWRICTIDPIKVIERWMSYGHLKEQLVPFQDDETFTTARSIWELPKFVRTGQWRCFLTGSKAPATKTHLSSDQNADVFFVYRGIY